MLIITISSANGLENGAKSNMANRAANSMFLWTQQTSMPYKGFKSGRGFSLNNGDVEYLRDNVATIDQVSPRIQLGGYQGANNVSRGVNTGAFNVYGDTPQYINIEPIDVFIGRYINAFDIEEKRKVCVIGKRVYEVLFPDEKDPIGEYIRINGVNFMVIGVYRSYRKGEDAEEATQSIFTPISTFQTAFHFGDYVGWLSILMNDRVSADVASKDVVDALKYRKSVHPDDPRAFGFWSMAEEAEQIDTIFTGMSIVAYVFGGLVFLAGVVGIVNIMLITVKERTKEIGVRRSLGATPGSIIQQIITETLFLTVISGLVGVITGVGAIEGLAYLLKDTQDGMFLNPSIGFNTIVIALLIMIISGIFAGLLPALRAISIKPVDAIRTE